MILVVGNFSYEVERFNVSISYSFDELINRIDVGLKNKNVNLETLSAEIRNNFTGTVVLKSGSKTYNYTGYNFESIDMNVDSRDVTVSVRFLKNDNE